MEAERTIGNSAFLSSRLPACLPGSSSRAASFRRLNARGGLPPLVSQHPPLTDDERARRARAGPIQDRHSSFVNI